MKKIDALLKKVEFFERLAVYGDRKSFLKSIAQGVSYPGDIEDTYGKQPQTVSNTTIVGVAPIPRDVQEMLSNITVVEGLGLPLDIDGDMGPKTREALTAFRGKFNVPGNFSEKDALEVVKNTYNRDPQRYGQLIKSKGQTPAAKPQAPSPAPASKPGGIAKFDPNWGARDVGNPSIKPNT